MMLLLLQSEKVSAKSIFASLFHLERTSKRSVCGKSRFLLAPEKLSKESNGLAVTASAKKCQHIDNESCPSSSTERKSIQARRKEEERQAVAWAFLVSPQKVSKKSQEYEKRLHRHLWQLAVMQTDVFSRTTMKFIQATNKACLPSRRAAPFLLKAEKLSRKTHQVSLFNLYLLPQIVDNSALPFNDTSPKSGATSRRKNPSHPRYPRHPWSISALFAFSAVKSLSGSSPCLRISVVKSPP